MGDRGNIAIQDGGKRVYLYGHWAGHDLPEIVRAALARKQRWDDPPYLTRIIFQQMAGDDKGETGFGISTEPGDNEYPFLIVDCDQQEVRPETDTREHYKHCKVRKKAVAFPFEKFAALPEATWADLDTGRKAEAE